MICKAAIAVVMMLSGAFASTEKDALEFFDNYRQRSQANDTSIISMYHDSAAIKTRRAEADGSLRNLELRGQQWKTLLQKTLEQAKQNNDIDDFKNVTVTRSGSAFTIKAIRSSSLKCTIDSGFYMIVKETKDGLKIFEEYTTTHAVTKCAGAKGVEAIIDAEVAKLIGQLPVMADEETRLDQVTRNSETLVYTYTLIHLSKEELDEDEFVVNLWPTLAAQVCRTDLKKIPANGGAVQFQYHDQEHKSMISFRITQTVCSQEYGSQ